MGELDPQGWFTGEELEACASCGERGAIRLPSSGSHLCLVCGSVTTAERHPSPTEDEPAIDDVGRSEQHS
jgi:hypothetical protein